MFARSLALVLLTFPAMATPLMAGEDIGIIDSGTDRVSLDLPSDDTPPPPDIDGATPWYFDHGTGEWVYLTIIDDSNPVDDDTTPSFDEMPPDEVEFTKGEEEGCDGCDVHAFGVPGSEETDTDDIEIRLRSFTPDVTAATDDPASDMPSEPAVVATSGEAIDPALLEELRARVEAELLRRATDG